MIEVMVHSSKLVVGFLVLLLPFVALYVVVGKPENGGQLLKGMLAAVLMFVLIAAEPLKFETASSGDIEVEFLLVGNDGKLYEIDENGEPIGEPVGNAYEEPENPQGVEEDIHKVKTTQLLNK